MTWHAKPTNAASRVCQSIRHHAARIVLTILARSVIRTLNAAEVDYWADFGTLLGLVRDGGIILGDTDVDVSVVETPEDIAKLDALCERRHFWFVLYKDVNRRSYCCDFKIVPVHCDIYVYRPDAGGRKLMGCEGPFSDLDRRLIASRIERDWNGLMVRIPARPEDLLEFRYGDDWRVKRLGYLGRLHSTYHPGDAEEAKLRRLDSGW